jgi:hypothetical protein
VDTSDDGTIGSSICPSQQTSNKKMCADGEYEGDLNSCGEREGQGIMRYLGDPTTKG